MLGICAGGCALDAPLGGDIPASYRVVVDTPAELRDKLDLLFVIDDSENMTERQNLLGHAFREVKERLSFGRGVPDLHIGVVSTDMGVGDFSVPGCTATGDGGRMAPPTALACDAPTDTPFLQYAEYNDGAVLKNFEGSLEDAFACAASLGDSGCDYEQPLKALRTALDGTHPENDAFLRSDAVLGVVVLSDEDDCSATDPSLFDPDNARFLQGDSDFRCFESGVICDGDDVYAPGLRDGCQPREDSRYVADVSEYVQFLATLKPEARDRVVTGIIGDPRRVDVARSADQAMSAQLMPSCWDETGASAYPAVRLNAFMNSVSEFGQSTSLCDAGPLGGLTEMVYSLRQAMGTTCLEGWVLDTDSETPGLDVDCFVYEESAQGDRRFFPECEHVGYQELTGEPCYSILTGGEACGDFQTQLALQVYGRDAPPASDSRLIAKCLVADEP